MDDGDLFGYTPPQGSLFGEAEDRIAPPRPSTAPDPERLRLRLHALVAKARGAERMPWPERDVRMWRTVFPNMAGWLPGEEAAELQREFFGELDRLSGGEAA